ncbi:MAG TPA: hypothetical protein VF169_28280 [Albitalea sp.]|uniref:hypothetical protein n=1 Tax=Piscinibacter sp. TaxID=1903157 RepID=UPI002ED64788
MNRYQVLFDAYVRELEAAQAYTLQWWDDLVAREASQQGPDEDAEAEVRRRWPMGPASHPRVIAVFRKHFLLCEALNEQLAQGLSDQPPEPPPTEDDWGDQPEEGASDDYWAEEHPIEPPVFMFDLLEGRHPDLREFMTFYVYNAIGERNGRSV